MLFYLFLKLVGLYWKRESIEAKEFPRRFGKSKTNGLPIGGIANTLAKVNDSIDMISGLKSLFADIKFLNIFFRELIWIIDVG